MYRIPQKCNESSDLRYEDYDTSVPGMMPSVSNNVNATARQKLAEIVAYSPQSLVN